VTSDERFVASVMQSIRENPGLRDHHIATLYRLREATVTLIRKRMERESSDDARAA
jgi:hypothetical protein